MTIDPPIDCRRFQQRVSDLIDGDLSAAESASLESHGRDCAVCGPLLRTLRETLRLCANERQIALPDEVQRRLRSRIAAAIAADESASPAENVIPSRLRASGSRRFPPRLLWGSAWSAAVLLLVMALSVARWHASAETTYGWLMDQHCLAAFRSDPGDNPRDCLLKCAKYGYGVLDAKGNFLAFDPGGNRTAQAAIAATSQPDHLWVKVRGRSSGRTLTVQQLTLEPQESASSVADPMPAVLALPLLGYLP